MASSGFYAVTVGDELIGTIDLVQDPARPQGSQDHHARRGGACGEVMPS